VIWRVISGVLLAALVSAAVPLIRHLREQPPQPPPVVRMTLPPPANAEFSVGDAQLDAALAPDGTAIAFVAASQGQVQLWLRTLSGDRAEALAGTDAAAMPAWMRTGRVIAFFSGGALKQVSLDNRRVSVLASAPSPLGAAWQEDGSLLFVPDARSPVKVMRGGVVQDATRLQAGDRGHAFPAAAGDGAFIYVAMREDGSRTLRYRLGSDERDLGPTTSHAEIAGDVAVHVRDGVLIGQRIDPVRHQLAGRAVPLVTDVGVAASGRGFFAASARAIVSAPAGTAGKTVTWFDATGTRLGAAMEPGDYWQVRMSPDDRRLALTGLDPLLRTFDVFAVPVAEPANLSRVSLSLGADTDPVWAPDSQRVAFRSLQRGASGVLARRLGGRTEEMLLRSDSDDTPSDWYGSTLLLWRTSPASGRDIWLLDSANGTRRQITTGGFNEWDAHWSPDHRWLAYVSDESGQPEIYVDAWPAAGRRRRLSFAGGVHPQWANGGRDLYFQRGAQVLRATRAGDGNAFTVPETVIEMPALVDFAVTKRGDRVAVLAGAHPASTAVLAAVDWTGLVPAAPPR
jgi:Tol biopolymer transport system component